MARSSLLPHECDAGIVCVTWDDDVLPAAQAGLNIQVTTHRLVPRWTLGLWGQEHALGSQCIVAVPNPRSLAVREKEDVVLALLSVEMYGVFEEVEQRFPNVGIRSGIHRFHHSAIVVHVFIQLHVHERIWIAARMSVRRVLAGASKDIGKLGMVDITERCEYFIRLRKLLRSSEE